MKQHFKAYGWREVTEWECPDCHNYWIGGADIGVHESMQRHREVCGPHRDCLNTRAIDGALGLNSPSFVTTDKVVEAIKNLAQRSSYSRCVCKWEDGKVVYMCSAHQAASNIQVQQATKGLYKIMRHTCQCGGSWAWARINDYGQPEMVGCFCHTVIIGGKLVSTL